MLAYAGGMFSPSYLSLTGRIGTFISGAGSLSADLGVSSSGGSASLNLGVMNFFRQKIFAGGYGLGVWDLEADQQHSILKFQWDSV